MAASGAAGFVVSLCSGETRVLEESRRGTSAIRRIGEYVKKKESTPRYPLNYEI